MNVLLGYTVATLVLPNNKTGNNCAQKGVGQDGSHVTEKVPLKDKIKNKNLSQRVYPAAIGSRGRIK